MSSITSPLPLSFLLFVLQSLCSSYVMGSCFFSPVYLRNISGHSQWHMTLHLYPTSLSSFPHRFMFHPSLLPPEAQEVCVLVPISFIFFSEPFSASPFPRYFALRYHVFIATGCRNVFPSFCLYPLSHVNSIPISPPRDQPPFFFCFSFGPGPWAPPRAGGPPFFSS